MGTNWLLFTSSILVKRYLRRTFIGTEEELRWHTCFSLNTDLIPKRKKKRGHPSLQLFWKLPPPIRVMILSHYLPWVTRIMISVSQTKNFNGFLWRNANLTFRAWKLAGIFRLRLPGKVLLRCLLKYPHLILLKENQFKLFQYKVHGNTATISVSS